VTQVQLYVKKQLCDLNKFLALVGTSESGSEHPIGLAITNFAKEVSLWFTISPLVIPIYSDIFLYYTFRGELRCVLLH